MQIIYREKYTELRIPVDYCNTSLMGRLCKIVVDDIECESWGITGLYLTRIYDDEDILSAKNRLEPLFYKKAKRMNVTEEEHFLEDLIILTTNELLEYFGDFAVYYMEIVVRPQNEAFAFPKIETEADANYLYVKMNNKNKACIEKLLKCIGVDKLKKIEYENNGYIWNEDLFYRLKAEFSEINDYLRYKSEILKKHGLIKKRVCIEMGRLKRKMKLIYDVSDKNGDQLKIILLEVASKHNADRLQILFF